ncbi:MAG: carbohydrate-binding protein, partial [Oscillospiraceae bacterium]|nr:carbohydrate-binding protein [Oscillospiraceae bacterium]
MKRIFSILLCICLHLGLLPVSAAELPEEKPATKGSYAVPSFGTQPLWEKLQRRIPMVVSHKTDWRNFPEASILGINSCLNMGVEIIEVDFHVTKDGVPVALHDDNLRRMTNADTLIYINEITWAQAKKYTLEDGMGNTGTPYILTAEDAKVLNSLPTYVANVGTAKAGGTMPISRFDSILELVNKQAILLMDKVADATAFSYAYICAREWDMLDYVMFKGNYTVAELATWFEAGAAAWNKKYPNEPLTAEEVKTSIIFEYNSNSPAKIQQHLDSGLRVLCIAAGVNDSNEAHIRNTLVPYLEEKGIALRSNTGESWMGANAKTDSGIGWAELLDIGYTVIMTDRPGPLVNYMQETSRIRPASDRIDAEHFNYYNFDSFGFTVPEDWNSGKNKVVSNLTSKDTLVYYDIEFDGTENIFTAKAAATNSTVTAYLDGTAAANKLGTVSFNSTSYTSAQVKINNVTPGKHRVYLKFTGTVALDAFRFTRGLYFGFANERNARFRYQDRLYGSLNFDTANWFPRPASLSSANLDNTAGTMTVTMTAGGNHYIQTGTVVGDRPLHYIPQTGDYFQMRLKISNIVANDSATAMTAGVVYEHPGKEDFDYGARVVQTITEANLNGQYFTITLPMNSTFTNATEITALRLYFTNLAPVSGKTATITIDEVYIGPKEHLPEKDYLYFDFADRDTDEMRYMTSKYGYKNFDNTQWFARTATMRGAWFENQSGTLLAHVTTGGNHYIQSGTSLNDRPLSYTPSQTDYLQMRMRIDNGKAYDESLPLSIGIAYASAARTEFYYNPLLRHNYEASILNSGYFTVTIPMPEFFLEESEIQSVRIYINNLAPKDGEAVVEVDSFYIGPEASLPDPLYTVTFLNEDGSLLATEQVAQGDTARYTADIPTKAGDEHYHYLFTGWDQPLTDIAADTVFTAQFNAEAHSYTDGLCTCGAVENKEPVEDSSLKLSHSLNLASDISVNLVVLKSALEGFDMDTVYVESTVDLYEGNTLKGSKTLRILPEEKGNFYYFTLTGLTAVHMNDRISSVLYGTKEGQAYYSATDNYSIADYAYAQLEKTNVAESLKQLCADLLRYGSMAQIYKSYRTDFLADGAMTDAQQAYLSSVDAVSFGNNNTVLNDLESPTLTWAGKSLDLASRVTVKYVFDASAYTGSVEDLSLHVSYLDVNGVEKELVLTQKEVYSSERCLYAFNFDGLLAAELRTVVSAQIYT